MKRLILLLVIVPMLAACGYRRSPITPITAMERLERLRRVLRITEVAGNRLYDTLNDLHDVKLITDEQYAEAANVVEAVVAVQGRATKAVENLSQLTDIDVLDVHAIVREAFRQFHEATSDRKIFKFANELARRRVVVVANLLETAIAGVELALELRRTNDGTRLRSLP